MNALAIELVLQQIPSGSAKWLAGVIVAVAVVTVVVVKGFLGKGMFQWIL